MREVIGICIFSLLVSHLSFAQGGFGAPSGGFNPGMGFDQGLPEDYFKLSKELMQHEEYPSEDFGAYPIGEIGNNPAKEQSVVKAYDKGVRSLLEHLPDSSIKDGLNHYLEIINSKSYMSDGSVGGSNSGIVAYNSNTLRDNVCFSQLAEAMFNDINSIDKDYMHTKSAEKEDLYGRPSLATESGKEPFKDLKPGWLMDKAMEYAGGDPNLAFSLLAVCGHDDTAQGNLNYKLEGKAKMSANPEKYIEIIDIQIKQKEQIVENLTTKHNLFTSDLEEYKKQFPFEFSDMAGFNFEPYPEGYDHATAMKPHQDQIERLKEFKKKILNKEIEVGKTSDVNRFVSCPRQNSVMYLSKALGEDADLSDEFKDKVAGIQAPTKGRKVIPSKNYHIMASAFMSCQLISKGFSPKLAATVQEMAAWAYRTVRINGVVKSDLGLYNGIEYRYKAFVKKFKEENTKRIRTPRGTREVLDKKVPSMLDWMFTNRGSEELKYLLPSDIETKEDIEKYMVRYDAAKVIDEMTLGGGKLFGQSIPHTNISLNFIGDPIQKHINQRQREAMRGENKRYGSRKVDFGWTKDRHDRAKEKAMTYLMDWDWTTEQHKTGATFASDKCEKKPLDFKPDDKACEVFGDRPGITCDIDYYTEVSLQNSNLGGMMMHGPTAPIFKTTADMEKIKDKMQEKYLDSEIEVEVTDEGLKVQGLY